MIVMFFILFEHYILNVQISLPTTHFHFNVDPMRSLTICGFRRVARRAIETLDGVLPGAQNLNKFFEKKILPLSGPRQESLQPVSPFLICIIE